MITRRERIAEKVSRGGKDGVAVGRKEVVMEGLTTFDKRKQSVFGRFDVCVTTIPPLRFPTRACSHSKTSFTLTSVTQPPIKAVLHKDLPHDTLPALGGMKRPEKDRRIDESTDH